MGWIFNGGHYSISSKEVPIGITDWKPIYRWVDIADHTYVICLDGGQKVKFYCYGEVAGSHNVYPAVKGSGNIRLAKAICCFNPDENRNDYNKKLGGRLLLGDCCGIVYGVTGVCHQMANRILAASNAGIMAAPGYWASFPVYGIYGNGGALTGDPIGLVWPAYFLACKAMVGLTTSAKEPREMVLEKGLEADFRQKACKLEADEAENPELSTQRLKLLVEHRLGLNFNAGNLKNLMQLQTEFDRLKKKLDEAYMKGSISVTRHASMVNLEHNKMLFRSEQILSPDEYKKLWGLEPGHIHELINPEIAAGVSNGPEAQ